jgi:hypothetical protein
MFVWTHELTLPESMNATRTCPNKSARKATKAPFLLRTGLKNPLNAGVKERKNVLKNTNSIDKDG